MTKIRYANVVGSIMYCMVCSRPDLAYAISMFSRFMANPGLDHWTVLKWVLRYLKGTTDRGLLYESGIDKELVRYVDSNFTGSLDTRKSLSGYVFILYLEIMFTISCSFVNHRGRVYSYDRGYKRSSLVARYNWWARNISTEGHTVLWQSER